MTFPPMARWRAECARAARRGEAPQLWRATAREMAWHWAAGSILRNITDMMDFVRPLVMQQILIVIEGRADQLAWWAPPPERMWLLAFVLFGSAMTWTFCNVHFNFLLMNKSIRIRSAIIAMGGKVIKCRSPLNVLKYTSDHSCY